MFRHLIIASLVGFSFTAPSPDKVDGKLRTVLGSQGHANVVVSFAQGNEAVLNRINGMRFDSRIAKINTMKAQLEDLQAATQKNALSLLSGSSLTFHPLWINNRIYIQGATSEILANIAALPEVAEVREEYVMFIGVPVHSRRNNASIDSEWGVAKIQADQAWSLPGGNNGAGVVVGKLNVTFGASIDTGARHTHEAIRDNYRADYGWFDPYDANKQPVDLSGHGTHVIGTIAGYGGIGVAPGAQWIACRGCNSGACSETALNRCGQWIACPTLHNGESADCSKVPAIVSNSWSGRGGQNWYNPVINAWQTAGIIPVFSSGNDGPYCGTVHSPGDNANVIGVGSTDNSDTISYFSSRGPNVAGVVKPDVSAPGSDIRSAYHTTDTAYATMSGTSMATPHASGTIALLLSQNPNLLYNQVKSLLQDNTDRDLGDAATCGNTPPTKFPNNIYGYGRINARKSLAAAINANSF